PAHALHQHDRLLPAASDPSNFEPNQQPIASVLNKRPATKSGTAQAEATPRGPPSPAANRHRP
ncbi:MAG: hypothetical protein ACYCU8_13905, partial [Ferrimicrobium acidiphilum]